MAVGVANLMSVGHSEQARSDSPRDSNASRELRSDLTAIHSYPDELAKKPGLTFEQHLLNVLYGEDEKSVA